MINEMDNKAKLSNGLSDLEFTKNSVEMMRYRLNKHSYTFGLVGLACSILGAFICLNSMDAVKFTVILIILLNIAVLLFGFLSLERVKAYSKFGSISTIVIGGVCFARMFWIPLTLLIKYGQYIASGKDANVANGYLGSTILDTTNTINWLPNNGFLRGGMAMGLFFVAGACFVYAGITGYFRANKLAIYLDSLKETK